MEAKGMFDPEKIALLNELEMVVCDYLLKHPQEVATMTIRQLSDVTHVSTSTILRCCGKLGFQGFSELKYVLKSEIKEKQVVVPVGYEETSAYVDSFFKRVYHDDYRNQLTQAINMVQQARHIAFVGIGTSGILGEYGSRYFVNFGLNAYSISDPFAPVPKQGLENTLAIVLSVSGETKQMVIKTKDFKRYGASVLSITNNQESTIARLADYNLSYYMPELKDAIEKHINMTTQVPVVTLIELLAQGASEKISLKKKTS